MKFALFSLPPLPRSSPARWLKRNPNDAWAYTRQTAGSTPTTTGVVRRRYKQLPAGPETSPNFLALYVAQLIKACLLFVRQQPVEGLQFRLHDLDGIEHHAEPLLH